MYLLTIKLIKCYTVNLWNWEGGTLYFWMVFNRDGLFKKLPWAWDDVINWKAVTPLASLYQVCGPHHTLSTSYGKLEK